VTTLRARLLSIPGAIAIALAIGLVVWRVQLIRVQPAREQARPLELEAVEERDPLVCDVVLPVVPVGMARLRSPERPLLIHYWAPWERHGRTQAAALDSLSRLFQGRDLRIVMVCFDPFPSVARFVARQRLRVTVLLDGPGLLRASVPCPSLPHTVLIDRHGRVAARQSGEVDWLSPETSRAIERVLAEPEPSRPPVPGAITRWRRAPASEPAETTPPRRG
jgi:peroxiredoxin